MHMHGSAGELGARQLEQRAWNLGLKAKADGVDSFLSGDPKIACVFKTNYNILSTSPLLPRKTSCAPITTRTTKTAQHGFANSSRIS